MLRNSKQISEAIYLQIAYIFNYPIFKRKCYEIASKVCRMKLFFELDSKICQICLTFKSFIGLPSSDITLLIKITFHEVK